jgi:hypothetical protein
MGSLDTVFETIISQYEAGFGRMPNGRELFGGKFVPEQALIAKLSVSRCHSQLAIDCV